MVCFIKNLCNINFKPTSAKLFDPLKQSCDTIHYYSYTDNNLPLFDEKIYEDLFVIVPNRFLYRYQLNHKFALKDCILHFLFII